MKRVTEKTALALVLKSFGATNAPITPSTLRYRIDCLATGKEILAWTPLTPGNEVSIIITPEQNTVVARSNNVERKRVTFEADSGTLTAYTDDWEYEIRQLPGY